MSILPWAREALRSGTIASLVMMPVGFVFQAMGLRVGHYGPKFAQLWVDHPTPLLLFAQHVVLGWVSALPLLWWLVFIAGKSRPVLSGALYGSAYYVVVNSLALPLYFGDPLPWQLGLPTVIPSLLVHIIYGSSIGWTARRFCLVTALSRKPSNL